MPLDPQIKRRLEKALHAVDERGARGQRLVDDARRFCRRVHRLMGHGLAAGEDNGAALELACYALQLPLRALPAALPAGRPQRPNLRERAQAAAEMLLGILDGGQQHPLVERTIGVLNDVHQRYPAGELARLLADALNLEDFGLIGLINQTIAIARQGGGIEQVADGMNKREQYGYWDARLDGFHFTLTRQMARRRLEHARKVAAFLKGELEEDGG